MNKERGISLESLELMENQLHKSGITSVVGKITDTGEIVLAINGPDKVAHVWERRGSEGFVPQNDGKITSSSEKTKFPSDL